jgi:hypothetical protein
MSEKREGQKKMQIENQTRIQKVEFRSEEVPLHPNLSSKNSHASKSALLQRSLKELMAALSSDPGLDD